MKFLDEVKVIKNRPEYKKDGVVAGMIGTIINAEIRDNEFYVSFETDDDNNWFVTCGIKIKDLELIKDNHTNDKSILEDIPLNNPNWWCKVEDGYIINLKGERKNKIPYDYDS